MLMHLTWFSSYDFCLFWIVNPDWLVEFMIWPSFCMFALLPSDYDFGGCPLLGNGITRPYSGPGFCTWLPCKRVGLNPRPCTNHWLPGSNSKWRQRDNSQGQFSTVRRIQVKNLDFSLPRKVIDVLSTDVWRLIMLMFIRFLKAN